MEKKKLEIGDIIQINPVYDDVFGGCLMIITEPKEWGAQGYVQIPGKDGGRAFFRCRFEGMEFVGKAEWIRDNANED
jgi:hypothetical protein